MRGVLFGITPRRCPPTRPVRATPFPERHNAIVRSLVFVFQPYLRVSQLHQLSSVWARIGVVLTLPTEFFLEQQEVVRWMIRREIWLIFMHESSPFLSYSQTAELVRQRRVGLRKDYDVWRYRAQCRRRTRARSPPRTDITASEFKNFIAFGDVGARGRSTHTFGKLFPPVQLSVSTHCSPSPIDSLCGEGYPRRFTP